MRTFFPVKKRPGVRKTHSGYGLVLMLVFLLSTMLIAAVAGRLSINYSLPIALKSYQDNIMANTMTSTAFYMVKKDILSKLNAGTTVDTTYTYGPQNMSVPNAPNALNGATSVVGTYSGKLLYARGVSYMVKVTATYGSSTVSKVQLMQLKSTTFNCSTVTNAIQAGHLSTVSNANLISYAQNNCMLITATPPSAPTTNDGSTACGTQTGSGTLQLASSLNCTEAVNGTYSTVYLHSGASISGGSFASTATSARTINIPGTVASGVGINISGSSGAHTVLFSDSNNLINSAITGGSGDDIFRLNAIYETSASSGGGATTTWDAEAGNNQVYAQEIYTNASQTGATTATTIQATGSSGSNQIYFDNLTDSGFQITYPANISITGGSGNDTISCNAAFGSSPACTMSVSLSQPAANGTIQIDGGAGNNIISLNGTLSATTASGSGSALIKIYGGSNTGYNIIYVNSCSTSATMGSSASVTISPGPSAGGIGSGKNLVIVNNLANCTFSGQASGDVLLYHTGTPPGTFTPIAY